MLLYNFRLYFSFRNTVTVNDKAWDSSKPITVKDGTEIEITVGEKASTISDTLTIVDTAK